MSKVRFIIIVVFLILIFGFVIFMNYSKIENYVNNKQWEVITPVATISLDKYMQSRGCGDKLLVVDNDKISIYSNSNIDEFKETINFKEVVIGSEGDYCVVGEKNGSKLLLFNEKGKVWDFDVNGEILAVSVNKNGYVVCIFAKSGYKSLVKAINPNGEELFTNYLASTYALDADISSDNKHLAIAEVNTDGITIEPDIKIVDVNNATDSGYTTIKLDNGSLILDVEYTDKGELLVLQDNKISRININNEVSTVREYDSSQISYISIENDSAPIMIEKNDTGIFSTEYVLKIYDTKDEYKEHTLDGAAKAICAQGKMICIDVGNEILFLNSSGKLVKRCKINGQAREIVMYKNGSMAGIVFKDRIEIVKL